MPPKKGRKGKATTKGASKARGDSVPHDVDMADPASGAHSDAEMSSQPPTTSRKEVEAASLAVPANEDSAASGAEEGASAGPKKATTAQERAAKMAQLRERMVSLHSRGFDSALKVNLGGDMLTLSTMFITAARVSHC
jgi:hypothetical protein